MQVKQNDIVLHTHDKNVIGIIRGKNVEWWAINTDRSVAYDWDHTKLNAYLRSVPAGFKYGFRFKARLHELGIPSATIAKDTDSPVVRKIKELDYKWELKMKEKGNFFLTSRALNVDQGTISPSTQTDTATALDVPTIPLRPILPPDYTQRVRYSNIEDFNF